jgi:hypothetical protein
MFVLKDINWVLTDTCHVVVYVRYSCPCGIASAIKNNPNRLSSLVWFGTLSAMIFCLQLFFHSPVALRYLDTQVLAKPTENETKKIWLPLWHNVTLKINSKL